jgi:hypothetical protein
LSDGNLSRPEFSFLEILTNNTKILLRVVYKAPHISYISYFEDALLRLLPLYDHVILGGDFNTNLLIDNSKSRPLRNIFDSCALHVLPIYPTYQLSLSYNPTWLDLLIVNIVDYVVNYGKIDDHGISKHSVIFLSFNLIIPKRKVKYITCRN